MANSGNYYARMGVSRDASADEIRSAYFELARKLHPDANPDPGAADQFIQVQEAYEILTNSEKRAVYDANLPAQEHQTPAISFTASFSRNILPPMDDPQLVYVMLDFTSIPDPMIAATPPLNLCLVLDRSTSMQGARMDMVKANAMQLLRQMKPQDLFSVVAFSDRAEVIIPSTRVSDLSRIESRISQLQTGGGTEIFTGLDAGLDQIRRSMSASYINHLILLTDGRTYGDEAACVRIAEEAAQQGIGITGLGIGHEWNDAFLDQLASLSGGSSMYISAPKELHKFLEQKYNSLGRVYAEQVTLEFETDPNVELRSVFRLQPEAGELVPSSRIRLGNIVQFQTLSVLLEFLVSKTPEDEEGVRLATGKVRMEIPTRSIPTHQFRLELSRPIGTIIDTEPPPNQIVQALSRLTLYRIQEKARREVATGDFNNATRHLQYLATHLLAQGERELAHTVLVEAEHIHKSQQFSKEGDKRIKYGTRALFLPAGQE